LGVNRTGGLAPLRAAVTGAREVAAWLRAEDLDVTCLDDETWPVTIGAVKTAIRKYVDLATVEQLVIYFAGHGYLNANAEIWLLSGAPDDPDEAIDQIVSGEYARSCGIRSVVFISDACRSNPPTVQAARVRGSSIFPNRQPGNTDVEVDRFFAAKPGDPALELSWDEATKIYVGLFTEILQQIHRNPDQSLTRRVIVDGAEAIVLPSWHLKKVLPDRVNAAAQARSVRLHQLPQLRLECGEDAFIARASFTGAPVTRSGSLIEGALEAQAQFHKSAAQHIATPGVFRWAETRSHESGLSLTGQFEPDFSAAVNRIVAADDPRHFETQTGIQVTGAGVSWARGFGLEARVIPAPRPALVHLQGAGPSDVPTGPGSILLAFEDGAGTVLAGLPGYVAAVTVENGRVVNVSYVPAQNSPDWDDYLANRPSLDRQRATAAAAARNGVLAVDRDAARRLVDSVREIGRIDPTLGLYAATACTELGLKALVRSMRDALSQQLNADLFDIAALSGGMTEYPAREQGRAVSEFPTVPFCPMLNQTWSFLRPRGLDTPGVWREAGRHRLPALWTTFGPEGMAILREASELGDLSWRLSH